MSFNEVWVRGQVVSATDNFWLPWESILASRQQTRPAPLPTSSSALFPRTNPGRTQRAGPEPTIPGDYYEPGKTYTPKRSSPASGGVPLHSLSLVLGREVKGREDYWRDSQDLGELSKRETKGNLLMLPVKKFYRPDEIAAFLGLSRRTVYRMLRDGRIVGVKIGNGPWRISREGLKVTIKSASKQ